jgi:hypothetical protein
MNFTPHDPDTDLMTAAEFQVNVKAGGFIRTDGDGYWATIDGHDMNASVWSIPQPAWATHVAWLNK